MIINNFVLFLNMLSMLEGVAYFLNVILSSVVVQFCLMVLMYFLGSPGSHHVAESPVILPGNSGKRRYAFLFSLYMYLSLSMIDILDICTAFS